MTVEGVISLLALLLIPMAVLPVVTAAVLFRELNSDSFALRERARIAQLLALMAITLAIIAARVVLDWDFDVIWVWLAFTVIVLVLDIASGVWLVAYLRRFR